MSQNHAKRNVTPVEQPFVATLAAISIYRDSIYPCLVQLQHPAIEKIGLDYLQAFEDPGRFEPILESYLQ